MSSWAILGTELKPCFLVLVRNFLYIHATARTSAPNPTPNINSFVQLRCLPLLAHMLVIQKDLCKCYAACLYVAKTSILKSPLSYYISSFTLSHSLQEPYQRLVAHRAVAGGVDVAECAAVVDESPQMRPNHSGDVQVLVGCVDGEVVEDSESRGGDGETTDVGGEVDVSVGAG